MILAVGVVLLGKNVVIFYYAEIYCCFLNGPFTAYFSLFFSMHQCMFLPGTNTYEKDLLHSSIKGVIDLYYVRLYVCTTK